jgi:hypothetical protein
MDISQFDIEFTKDGSTFDEAQVRRLLDDVPQFTDLFVLSHGWNNDMDEARALYDGLLGNISVLLDAGLVQGLQGRRYGALRVFWPSKKFADDELIPGGGAASATQANDDALLRLLERMKLDPVRLGGKDIDPVRAANLDAAQALVPLLETDAEARHDFVFRLRAILDASDAHPDDGSTEFFERDPTELFEGLKGAVEAPSATGGGGATAVHAGGAAGLSDLLDGIKAAARRLANFTTYHEMKQRAGVVGRTGVAQVLMRTRDRKPELRLHLIGHSFGGRLVTAAAHALPPGTSNVTLSLLQAAYSHNGLGQDYDGERHDGAFRALLGERRASGPIVITHTKNDRAVGIAYPLASRISRQQASALGDQNDPYGGMGRNGAQHTPEVDADAVSELLAVGRVYAFAPGRVYNLRADQFISSHSDVTGPQVAYAVLNAVRTV